jgi:hypothetical protein
MSHLCNRYATSNLSVFVREDGVGREVFRTLFQNPMVHPGSSKAKPKQMGH